MIIQAIFIFLMASGAGQASAQPVYKCTANGKISYGEAPCGAGAAQQQLSALASSAPPTHPDQNAKLRQEAQQLTQQRHRREAREEQAQQRADKKATLQRQKCANLQLQRQWAHEDAAHEKRSNNDSAKAALKARRADEKWTVECAR